MNTPKGTAALATILAATPALAQGQPRVAPDIKPSTATVELCQEVIRGMFGKHQFTYLTLMGGGEEAAPQVVAVERKQAAVDNIEVKCDLTGTSVNDLFAPGILTDGKGLRAVNLNEVFSSPPAPSALRQDQIQPPYQFIDHTGANRQPEPDGFFDDVCDEKACKGFGSYTYEQQRALQQRFEQLVRTTLDRYRRDRAPQQAPKTR